jgi:hypothetical protein
LKAKLSQDAIHAAFADGEASLAQFLSDDFRGGFRIQEAMANGLADQFLAAAVVGFRAAGAIEQAWGSGLQEGLAQLEIPLPTKTELSRCLAGAAGAAFALNQHGELQADLIGWGNGQRTTRPHKLFQGDGEGHGDLPPIEAGMMIPWSITESGRFV